MKVAEIIDGVVHNVIEVDPGARDFTEGWPEAGDAGPGWTYDGETFSPPSAPAPTAPDLLAALAARRYTAEEAGTTFGGYPLATDRTTQAKITAAYVKATADPDYTIASWKFAPGVFAPLTSAQIIAAADVMEAHVQLCFANEAAISALILAAETPEDLAAIDLEQGWP